MCVFLTCTMWGQETSQWTGCVAVRTAQVPEFHAKKIIFQFSHHSNVATQKSGCCICATGHLLVLLLRSLSKPPPSSKATCTPTRSAPRQRCPPRITLPDRPFPLIWSALFSHPVPPFKDWNQSTHNLQLWQWLKQSDLHWPCQRNSFSPTLLISFHVPQHLRYAMAMSDPPPQGQRPYPPGRLSRKSKDPNFIYKE